MDFRLPEPTGPDERITRIIAMNEAIVRMNEQIIKAITMPGIFIKNIQIDTEERPPES
ncbi:MAG: hypothetical protein ACK4NR_09375 [Micavibrio sp.]